MRTLFQRIGHWLDRQTRERPFLSALVVLLLVVVPGYSRLESALNTAERAATSAAETAKDVAKIAKSENARDKAVALSNCQTRNTASERGRERFDNFFTAIEVIFTRAPGTSPERQAATRKFVADLRTAVPLNPAVEDVDCNDDGKLGPEDYS